MALAIQGSKWNYIRVYYTFTIIETFQYYNGKWSHNKKPKGVLQQNDPTFFTFTLLLNWWRELGGIIFTDKWPYSWKIEAQLSAAPFSGSTFAAELFFTCKVSSLCVFTPPPPDTNAAAQPLTALIAFKHTFISIIHLFSGIWDFFMFHYSFILLLALFQATKWS